MPAKDYNVYMRKYMSDRYYRRRAEAVVELGGQCVDCGSQDDLEFDHVDRLTKTSPVAKILASGSNAKVAAEIAKCVLRCRPCHIEKSLQVGDYRPKSKIA